MRIGAAADFTYAQAGLLCFVEQDSDKNKMRFFLGNLFVKLPALV